MEASQPDRDSHFESSTDDSREKTKAARRLIWTAVKRRKRHFITSVTAATVYVAGQSVIPQVVKRTIDEVITGRQTSLLPRYMIVLVALGVCIGTAGAVRKYQAAKMMALAGNDVRDNLYEHLQRLSFSFHDKLGAGQLMARASSDVTMVENALAFLPFTLQSIGWAVVSIAMLFSLQPFLAACVLVLMIVTVTATMWSARPIYPVSRKSQEQVGEFSEFVAQRINGIRVVKGHGLEDVHRNAGHRLTGRIHEVGVKLATLRARFGAVSSMVPMSGLLLVLGVGGWMGSRGVLTLGALMAFLQYLGMLNAPVITATQVMSIWPQCMASATRIAEVLSSEPDVAPPARPARLTPGPGTVRFEDVTFEYEPASPVLEGFTLEIAGGTSVALVGTSGSGKSTVAQLIPRFYDPVGGRVTLDGADVRALSMSELRQAVSVVFEDTVLFTSTIRENIALGRPTANYPEVRRAAELAHADDFIKELEDGYDTVVGEQGMSLSGGQRQRLAIARAILRDPRVLILDDAMSAVDPIADEAIRLGLTEVMRGRTTLIIAHRVETLALADRVVLLDGGKILAQGTHAELLRLPAYRRALAIDELVARAG